MATDKILTVVEKNGCVVLFRFRHPVFVATPTSAHLPPMILDNKTSRMVAELTSKWSERTGNPQTSTKETSSAAMGNLVKTLDVATPCQIFYWVGLDPEGNAVMEESADQVIQSKGMPVIFDVFHSKAAAKKKMEAVSVLSKRVFDMLALLPIPLADNTDRAVELMLASLRNKFLENRLSMFYAFTQQVEHVIRAKMVKKIESSKYPKEAVSIASLSGKALETAQATVRSVVMSTIKPQGWERDTMQKAGIVLTAFGLSNVKFSVVMGDAGNKLVFSAVWKRADMSLTFNTIASAVFEKDVDAIKASKMLRTFRAKHRDASRAEIDLCECFIVNGTDWTPIDGSGEAAKSLSKIAVLLAGVTEKLLQDERKRIESPEMIAQFASQYGMMFNRDGSLAVRS